MRFKVIITGFVEVEDETDTKQVDNEVCDKLDLEELQVRFEQVVE